MSNSLMTIYPYYYKGCWVFDDDEKGLLREPFVSGIPEMIDILVKDIETAKDGFSLIFSDSPFPGYQMRLEFIREEFGGNWYRYKEMEGWLCPALFHYFDTAPKEIYCMAV